MHQLLRKGQADSYTVAMRTTPWRACIAGLAVFFASATTQAQVAEIYPELTVHAAPRDLAENAVIEDWPSFMGERRDSHCNESPLATQFGTDGPALLWEMNCGSGFSSPVVVGNRLVYTHRVGDRAFIDCLDASTGKRFWRYETPCDYEDRYIKNSGPRSTPEIASGRVFVHGVDGHLTALELATGKLLWQKNTVEEFDVGPQFFGIVSSPLVIGKYLIQNIGAKDGPCVAGFDLATGEVTWTMGDKWGPSCASPITAIVHGKRKLFVFAGGESRPPTGGLMGIDLDTQTLDFEHSFRSRTYESVIGATPLIDGNRVFLTGAYNMGSAALELDKDGSATELWADRHRGQEFANQVLLDGVLYLIDGVNGRSGAVVAVDPSSGEELWRESMTFEEEVQEQGVTKTIPFSIGQGSLLVVGKQLLLLGDYGHLVTLLPSKDGVEVIAKASLFQATETWTPLVVSHGLLYVCQNNRARFGSSGPRLLCYDLRGK